METTPVLSIAAAYHTSEQPRIPGVLALFNDGLIVWFSENLTSHGMPQFERDMHADAFTGTEADEDGTINFANGDAILFGNANSANEFYSELATVTGTGESQV